MHVQGSTYETVATTHISIEDLRHTPSEAVLVTKCLQASSDNRNMAPGSILEDESLTSGDMASVSSGSTATPEAAARAPTSAAARAQQQRTAACGSVTTTLGSLASDVEAPRNVLPTGWLMFEVRFLFWVLTTERCANRASFGRKRILQQYRSCYNMLVKLCACAWAQPGRCVRAVCLTVQQLATVSTCMFGVAAGGVEAVRRSHGHAARA